MTNNQTKWTPEQDQMLREGVKRFGIKWEEVKRFMKNLRSVNSIIKRWHTKIKYESVMKDVRESIKRYPSLFNEQLIQGSSQPEEEEAKEKDQEEPKYNKMWTEKDDKKIKLLVVESGVLDWQTLANSVDAEVVECQIRWRNVIYPTMLRNFPKMGPSMKWTMLEDKILNLGEKKHIDWEGEGRFFLPSRTYGSIEARWRRIAKKFQIKQTIGNKHLALKECLRRIAKKETEAQEKMVPEEEDKDDK